MRGKDKFIVDKRYNKDIENKGECRMKRARIKEKVGSAIGMYIRSTSDITELSEIVLCE